MAITTNGPAGVLGTGLLTVESASASPDIVNQYRYATTRSDGATNVVPVTGDGSFGNVGAAIPIGGFNTDVASNFPGNRVVATYSVFTRRQVPATPGPGGLPEYFITDTQVYANIFINGVSVRGPILVNQQTDVPSFEDPDLPTESDSRIAMDGAGNFVVTWQSDVPGQAVMARQFNADGTAAGDQFVVSATGVEPDVARNAVGNFVIGYSIAGAVGAGTGTFFQAYNAGGVASGAAVRVTAEQFSEPAVGIANNGRVIIAWAQGDGAARRVVVQRYSSDLSTLGGAFSASSANNTPQTAPQLAVDVQGGFAVGWSTAVDAELRGGLGFRVFSAGANARAPDTTIGGPGGGDGGVLFLPDHRFGLAYRIPGQIHVAYNQAPADPTGTTGTGLMQTYTDDSVAGDEVDVPSGAYLVDLSSYAGVDLLISDEGSFFSVTINGTNTTRATASSIYVRGSATNDRLRMAQSITVPVIIYGRGGRDTIVGGQGNDLLDGGAGGVRNGVPVGDLINGAGGDDDIFTNGDTLSTVFGGAGDDTITVAGVGGLVGYGEDGNDTLIGGEAIDALDGGAGNDSITGGSGGDNIEGGSGDDILFGEDGRDYIFGSNGNDYINGGLDGDYLNGGRGQDRILGEGGRDTLLGGAEADYLRGGGSRQVAGNTGLQLDIYYYDTLDELSGLGTRLLVP